MLCFATLLRLSLKEPPEVRSLFSLPFDLSLYCSAHDSHFSTLTAAAVAMSDPHSARGTAGAQLPATSCNGASAPLARTLARTRHVHLNLAAAPASVLQMPWSWELHDGWG
jgi:hypothetical protein